MREYGHLTSNPGLITNLRFAKSGSTINFVQSNASALTVGDGAALVRYREGLTHELVEITAPISFTDGAGGSFDGNTLGTTGGVAWASDMPLFLYIAVRSGVAALMLSRNPCLFTTPATVGKIAQKGDANADTQDSVLFLTTGLTLSSWVGQYVQPLGGMIASKNASDQWTFTIDNRCGLGRVTTDLLCGIEWDFPVGHNGADAGKYTSVTSGGVGPSYVTTNLYKYQIRKDGTVRACGSLQNSGGGTAGSGSGTLQTSLPFTCVSATTGLFYRGLGEYTNGATDNGTALTVVNTWQFFRTSIITTPGAVLAGTDQSNASRSMVFDVTYPAFSLI